MKSKYTLKRDGYYLHSKTMVNHDILLLLLMGGNLVFIYLLCSPLWINWNMTWSYGPSFEFITPRPQEN